MKKLIYAAFILLAVAFTSCSKEARINRKLDGEWKVTSIAGQPIPTDQTLYFTFEKDGKKGKGSYSTLSTEGSYNVNFDYTLSGDKLTLTPTSGEITQTEILTITKYESKRIEFIAGTLSQTYVLEPK
ncbi:MAG: META domain-containing protein [Crocinitomicaceae bacterium]|jgi:hypothetical protein